MVKSSYCNLLYCQTLPSNSLTIISKVWRTRGIHFKLLISGWSGRSKINLGSDVEGDLCSQTEKPWWLTWKDGEDRGRCTSQWNVMTDNPYLQSYRKKKLNIFFCIGLLTWLGDVKTEKALKTWPLLFYFFFYSWCWYIHVKWRGIVPQINTESLVDEGNKPWN